MIIQMSRPWRRPETGLWYFRSRVPADLTKLVNGQKVTVEVAGDPSTVKLTHTVKVSLRTRDGNEARLRHASVQAQPQERRAAARKGAVSLSHKDIMALAGVWYRDLVMTRQDEPGDVDNWEVYQDLLGEGLAYFYPDGDGIEREAYDPKRGVSVLSQHFNIDDFLSARGP